VRNAEKIKSDEKFLALPPPPPRRPGSLKNVPVFAFGEKKKIGGERFDAFRQSVQNLLTQFLAYIHLKSLPIKPTLKCSVEIMVRAEV
jgi:hypothetical protein